MYSRQIEEWFDNGKEQGFAFMAVLCDTFDHSFYPMYFYSKTRNLIPLILAHGLWDSVPPSIIENQATIGYFATFPAENQVLVLILPFALAALATVIFTKYGTRRNWRNQSPK
jgi:hypothetical protein